MRGTVRSVVGERRAQARAQWRAESLSELRAGRGEHPLRRAFVHSVRVWDLDIGVVEEMLEAITACGAEPPVFTTVADQRRFLRGVTGTVAELLTSLLEPKSDPSRARRLMSVLGEALQLVEIHQDFSLDLVQTGTGPCMHVFRNGWLDGCIRGAAPQAEGTTVPNHVGVIVDGNRRWAIARGETVINGHRAGERALLRLLDAARDAGISHVTVFAFSTENWGAGRRRGRCAVRAVLYPPGRVRRPLSQPRHPRAVVRAPRPRFHAARALAAHAVAGQVSPSEIQEADLVREFYLPDLPDVDLLIRPSGEKRISGFLPWHLAYAELVFVDVHWPDFDRHHLHEAVSEYSRRRRRFDTD